MHRERTAATRTPGRKGSPQARRVVLVSHGERTQREKNDRLGEDRGKAKPSPQQKRDLPESSRHQQKAMYKKSPEFPRQQRQMSTRSRRTETGRDSQRDVEHHAKDHRTATHKKGALIRGLPTFKQISALSSKLRSKDSASSVTRRNSADPDVSDKTSLSYKVRRRSAAADASRRDAADPYFEDGDPSWAMDPFGPKDLETRMDAGSDEVGGTKTGITPTPYDAAGTRATLSDEDPGGPEDFEMHMHAGCDDVAGIARTLSEVSCLAASSSASAPFRTVYVPVATLINTSNEDSQPFSLPLPPIPRGRATVDPDELKMCFPSLSPLFPSAESRLSTQIEEEPQQSDASTHSSEAANAFQRWSELILQEAKLNIHKRRAVACEDYQGAGEFKSLLQELEACLAAARDFAVLCGVPSISCRLDEQKCQAVAKEDYEKASRLKRRILQLSSARDSASLHEAMLGALELARGLGALEDGPAMVEELAKALADHDVATAAAAVPVSPVASTALAAASASAAATSAPVAPAASPIRNTCQQYLATGKRQLQAPPPEELCSHHANLEDSENRNGTKVEETLEMKRGKLNEECEPLIRTDSCVSSKLTLSTRATGRDEVCESTGEATDQPTHLTSTHESDVEKMAAARRRVQQHIREEMNKQLYGQHQAKRRERHETSSAENESHFESSQVSCPIPGIKLEQFVTMSKQEIWQKAWDASWHAEDALGRSDDEANVYKIARRTWKAWVAQRNALAGSPEVLS